MIVSGYPENIQDIRAILNKNSGLFILRVIKSELIYRPKVFMYIDQSLLYFINSTYRNPERLVKVSYRLQKASDKNLSREELYSLVNEDVVMSRDSALTSFSRKKAELPRLGFVKITDEGKILTQIPLDNLQPKNVSSEVIAEREWFSNALLLGLSQKGHLKFIVSLIKELEAQWSCMGGHRKGVAELELVYAHRWLSWQTAHNNQTVILQDLVNKIVSLRLEFKQITGKKGHFKNWLKDKATQDFTMVKPSVVSIGSYIDSLIRTYTATGCFMINGDESFDKGAFMKMVQIAPAFEKKLAFFIDTGYLQMTDWVHDNSFLTKLYSRKCFDIKKAYEEENKRFTNLINNRPDKIELDIQQYVRTNDWTWYQYEKETVFLFFKSIYENDPDYFSYQKSIATKCDDSGNAYGGTTPKIADGSMVMSQMVVNIEATLICKEFTQELKELVSVKTHLTTDMQKHEKEKGLAIIVAPFITEGLHMSLLKTNHANQSFGDKDIIIALTTHDYAEFLKYCNTEEQLLKFHDFLSHINWLEYKNEKNVFQQLIKQCQESE